MKNLKEFEKKYFTPNPRIRPIVISDEEWDIYYSWLTDAVKENYKMLGFYIYCPDDGTTSRQKDDRKGILAMTFRGIPVVRKSDLYGIEKKKVDNTFKKELDLTADTIDIDGYKILKSGLAFQCATCLSLLGVVASDRASKGEIRKIIISKDCDCPRQK